MFISNLRTGVVSMFSLYKKEKSILIVSYIRIVSYRITYYQIIASELLIVNVIKKLCKKVI